MAESGQILNEVLGRDFHNPTLTNLLVAFPRLFGDERTYSQQGDIVNTTFTPAEQKDAKKAKKIKDNDM
jgi:hypothetical protein